MNFFCDIFGIISVTILIISCIHGIYYYINYFGFMVDCSLDDSQCVSQFIRPRDRMGILPRCIFYYTPRINDVNLSFIVMILFYIVYMYCLIESFIWIFKNLKKYCCHDSSEIETVQV